MSGIESSTAATGVELAWDVGRQNLAAQRELFTSLDNKAQAMIVLLTAALGAYVVAAKAVYERVAGGVGLVAAITLVVAAYTSSRFADAPGAAVFACYADYPSTDMKRYFIHAVLHAVRANEEQLRRRALLLNSAFVIVAVLGLVVVVVRASGIDHRGI